MKLLDGYVTGGELVIWGPFVLHFNVEELDEASFHF